MPVSEESIIAPQALNAKPPIKKSTIGWMAGIVLALALIGVVAPMFFTAAPAPVEQVPQSASVQPGDPGQIDRELVDAREAATKSASRAAAPASAPAGSAATAALPPGVPLPGGAAARPVIPGSARRDDASGALYAQALDPSVVAEMEAAARQSNSIKFDASGGEQPKADPDPVGTRLRNLLPPPPTDQGARDAEAERARERMQAAALEANRPAPATTGVAADRSWLRELGQGEAKRTPPLRTYKVTSPYTLMQGKVIPAVLTRDLNSDLPGLVTACTTLPMYDSITGAHLLIPPGSCLQGQYSSAVQLGQERILFAFTRLMLPDGTSVDLPANPGADSGGAAGVAGDVDNHFFRMFTTSLLVALLADRAEQGKTIVQSGSSNGQATGPATAAGQVLVDVSRTILERNRTIPPTIKVEKGTRINVEVTRDIEFPGAYGTARISQ